IRSFSELLLTYDDTEPETQREFLEIIVKESDRLGRLIDELLDDIMDNWGPMVDAGACTTWEVFAQPGFTNLTQPSHCHAWAGIPVIALMRHVLHIDALQNEQGAEDKTVMTKFGAVSYAKQ
ncbi:MAG: hypothetical protein HRU15_11835, partial [Planctomycetes bacterium]|nr:hypothetical protein [Planctomycetota bacterium]